MRFPSLIANEKTAKDGCLLDLGNGTREIFQDLLDFETWWPDHKPLSHDCLEPRKRDTRWRLVVRSVNLGRPTRYVATIGEFVANALDSLNDHL